jgi:hypothetical protein
MRILACIRILRMGLGLLLLIFAENPIDFLLWFDSWSRVIWLPTETVGAYRF